MRPAADEVEDTLGPTTFVPGAGRLGLPPPPVTAERAVAYAPGTAWPWALKSFSHHTVYSLSYSPHTVCRSAASE